MGAGHVEVIRSGMAAFSARDYDGWLATFHPDIEFHDHLSLNPEPYRGLEGITRWYRGWDRIWEDIDVRMDEVLLDEGEWLVFSYHVRARGLGSGLEVDDVFYGAIRFREGRGVWHGVSRNREEMLAVAGAGVG